MIINKKDLKIVKEGLLCLLDIDYEPKEELDNLIEEVNKELGEEGDYGDN